MKRLMCAVVVGLAGLVWAAGSTPEGWTDDYEAALKTATAENKLVLVDFSGSDWCGWCKRLDEEVFSKPEFISVATNKFVLLIVDTPSEQGLLSELAKVQNPKLVKKYGISGFPTVLILDKNGEKICKTGYQKGGPAFYLQALDDLVKGAPDYSRYIKPIEEALDGHTEAFQTEMESVRQDGFYDQEGLNEEYEQALYGEILLKYLPLFEADLAKAEAIEVPERLQAKKASLIHEKKEELQDMKEGLSEFAKRPPAGLRTRANWVALADRLARPILAPMAEGRLSEVYSFEKGTLEVSPGWGGRNTRVAYMEAFARLMAGLAPWLSLPDDETAEGKLRAELRTLALKAYAHAVNPDSPDYLGWEKGGQTLVDAAFLAQSFLRAWDALWKPLDKETKVRYIREFQGLRRYSPPYQNWVLFCSLEETFLLKAKANFDSYRLRSGIYKIEEWYVGDGWYSDGPSFAFDYYNSYVIQPMYYDVMKTLVECNKSGIFRFADAGGKGKNANDRLPDVLLRMQKQAVILERFISPEGTYPVFGRSIPYRMAVFQPLAQLAWEKKLPKELSEGQVRAGLEAVRARMFSDNRNFNKADFLTLGFNGSYPGASDPYTNNGSLYMTSLFLMPLGLPPTDSFWTAKDEPWTSKKAWLGKPFPKDHKWNINPQPLYWD